MVTSVGMYNESPGGKSKENYLREIKKIVQGKEAGKDMLKEKDEKDQEARNEAFNRKISAQIDQDLKDYVREFRRKVRELCNVVRRWKKSSKNRR